MYPEGWNEETGMAFCISIQNLKVYLLSLLVHSYLFLYFLRFFLLRSVVRFHLERITLEETHWILKTVRFGFICLFFYYSPRRCVERSVILLWGRRRWCSRPLLQKRFTSPNTHFYLPTCGLLRPRINKRKNQDGNGVINTVIERVSELLLFREGCRENGMITEPRVEMMFRITFSDDDNVYVWSKCGKQPG